MNEVTIGEKRKFPLGIKLIEANITAHSITNIVTHILANLRFIVFLFNSVGF